MTRSVDRNSYRINKQSLWIWTQLKWLLSQDPLWSFVVLCEDAPSMALLTFSTASWWKKEGKDCCHKQCKHFSYIPANITYTARSKKLTKWFTSCCTPENYLMLQPRLKAKLIGNSLYMIIWSILCLSYSKMMILCSDSPSSLKDCLSVRHTLVFHLILSKHHCLGLHVILMFLVFRLKINPLSVLMMDSSGLTLSLKGPNRDELVHSLF